MSIENTCSCDGCGKFLESWDEVYCEDCSKDSSVATLEKALLILGGGLKYFQIENMGASMLQAREIEKLIDEIKAKHNR